jgi:hypothetical protein
MRHPWALLIIAAMTASDCGRSTLNARGPARAPAVSPAVPAAAPPAALTAHVHQVAVTRFDNPYGSGSVRLTDADADAILADTTAVLATDDGPAANGDGDVACGVELTRAGSVSAFSIADAPGIINNPAGYKRVCAQPGYVHVVAEINWCGAFLNNIVGCADIGGTCMVVVRYNPQPILWAHEFGHTKGLDHSCGGKSPCASQHDDRVMHPYINTTHRKIGSAECAAYRK